MFGFVGDTGSKAQEQLRALRMIRAQVQVGDEQGVGHFKFGTWDLGFGTQDLGIWDLPLNPKSQFLNPI